MPVQAERIKWKLAPSFDPLPFLTDSIVREAYRNPDVLRKPEHLWPRLPRAIVHATKQNVLQLAEKWDQLGACQVALCDNVRSDEAVSMFSVPKDSDWDRLILNPTVVNSCVIYHYNGCCAYPIITNIISRT